jgi:hypothetical protein
MIKIIFFVLFALSLVAGIDAGAGKKKCKKP